MEINEFSQMCRQLEELQQTRTIMEECLVLRPGEITTVREWVEELVKLREDKSATLLNVNVSISDYEKIINKFKQLIKALRMACEELEPYICPPEESICDFECVDCIMERMLKKAREENDI